MNSLHKSERGASMLYVLAALIFVGFVSASMLKLSASDSVNAVFYKTSASARSAAKSGMISATHFFETGGDPVRVLLQKWVDEESAPVDSAFTWIRGGDNTYIDMEGNKVTDPSGIQAYKVELLAFDTSTFNVTLKSTGVGKGKSRAEITAVHHLDGLGFGTKQEWGDESALYLEDDIKLVFRAPIEVDGDVRLSERCRFDTWASGSIFHGKFRSELADPAVTMLFRGKYTFNDVAYMGTRPFLENAVHSQPEPDEYDEGFFDFKKKAGFPNGARLVQGHNMTDKRVELTFSDKSYWLQEPSTEVNPYPNSYLSLNNNYAVHPEFFDLKSDVYLRDDNKNAISTWNKIESNAFDNLTMLDSLGMEQVPCEINVHPEVIDPTMITDWTSNALNASDLNGWTGNTWNGFIVLRIRNNTVNVGSSGTLNKKVIVLVEEGGKLQATSSGGVFSVNVVLNGTKVDKDASGSFHIIIGKDGKVMTWGGWDKFRGLYYCLDDGEMQIGGSENYGVDELYGAIYANSGADSIVWHPMSNVEITPGIYRPKIGNLIYDPTVYEELDVNGISVGNNTNFLTKTGCTGNVPISTGQLVIPGDGIQASMVSQHF